MPVFKSKDLISEEPSIKIPDLKEEEVDLTKAEINVNFDGLYAEFCAETDIKFAFEKLLLALSEKIEISLGIAFIRNGNSFEMLSSYAFSQNEVAPSFEIGEGLSGEVAQTLIYKNISDIPENYTTVVSGLGTSSPKQLLIYPLISDNVTVAVIEIGMFKNVNSECADALKDLIAPMGDHVAKISGNK